MSEKRYFKIEYDEEWYLFDSTTISEQLVKEQAEYGYGVFANSLSPSEIVDLLNYKEQIIKEQHDEIINWTKKYVKLKEENEQLKSLVNACEYGQKSLMEEMKYNDEALDKIWEIMKELYGVIDDE